MLKPILLLIPLACALGMVLTLCARSLGHRLNAMDSVGVKGQVKAGPRRVPNTGGIGIFWGFAIPLAAGLVAINSGAADRLTEWFPSLVAHLPGLRASTASAWTLLGCVAALHTLGLIDDRRPLPALPKLLAMLTVGVLASWVTNTRLLTALDTHVGGAWLSIAITVLWIVVITNAFNFLDNMDGLSAGVAAICAAFFLVSALVSAQPQWFVAACLALLLGALLGFLTFNFPLRRTGATIFQGDGGSLVVGFLLAFLSVRITYVAVESGANEAAHNALSQAGPVAFSLRRFIASSLFPSLFTPLVILAIPLYDFVSVTIIRLSQGRSPFVGDLQHFSHRLVNHGLSRRAAVVVIYGCTAVTAIGGVALPSLKPWQAALVFVQTGLVLLVLGLYEWARTPATTQLQSPHPARPAAGELR